MDALSDWCLSLKPDFWLMGEVVAGDYRQWLFRGQNIPTGRSNRLDSITNYELYKGLWSCFNDKNFFEIAWTLNRQSGADGLYRDADLYTFADNHDVNRVASNLVNKTHLFPLYGLLFTVPGVPSIYYGSEIGALGTRDAHGDRQLRLSWGDVEKGPSAVDRGELLRAIKTFIRLRKENPVLREGSYRQLYVDSEQLAFMREKGGAQGGSRGGQILVAVNASANEARISIGEGQLGSDKKHWRDLLGGEVFAVSQNRLEVKVHPSWIRMLVGE
jgi:glycosidase